MTTLIAATTDLPTHNGGHVGAATIWIFIAGIALGLAGICITVYAWTQMETVTEPFTGRIKHPARAHFVTWGGFGLVAIGVVLAVTSLLSIFSDSRDTLTLPGGDTVTAGTRDFAERATQAARTALTDTITATWNVDVINPNALPQFTDDGHYTADVTGEYELLLASPAWPQRHPCTLYIDVPGDSDTATVDIDCDGTEPPPA
ncbi:MAG: hypothetical protein L0H59_17645, partial [Tomitella sp.]|nr:hypothetical protein [Tomitella sp.]